MQINSRTYFTAWKRNSAEYLPVVTALLRETKYLCPKCKLPINLSTAHCSHIISCKTLDKYKAYSLATSIHNLTICCKQCNLSQSSKDELDLVTDKLANLLNCYIPNRKVA
jgi:5-methylcytosine-specific restriction endonuclease McrA